MQKVIGLSLWDSGVVGSSAFQEQLRDGRLRLVKDATVRSVNDMLGLGLVQAVAELRGLGGMVHLSRSRSVPLRLTASVGALPAPAAYWASLAWDQSAAPALAARGDTFTWLPVRAAPTAPEGITAAEAQSLMFSGNAGLAAVSLPGPGGPVGALSVVTVTPDVPEREEREFLRDVAEEMARSLRYDGAPVWSGTLGSLESSGSSRQRTIDRALTGRTSFRAGYRVSRPAGSIGSVRTCGEAVPGERGEPACVVGAVWDATQAGEGVDRTPCVEVGGLIVVDADWRIAYVDDEAERLLGPAQRLLGRVLWDATADLSRLGLEDGCRGAVASGAPVTFGAQIPRAQGAYKIRVTPGPIGCAVYITAAAHERRDQAGRNASELAARMEELTAALARALTVQDVVDAVADHVLPLFGATGLLIQSTSISDGLIALEGYAGYPTAFTDHLSTLKVSDVSPAHEVLQTRVPRFIASPQEYISLYPEIAHFPAAGGKKAWAFLPLIAGGRPVGVIVISFDQPRRFSSEERVLIDALSGLVAQAIARARLYDAAHRQAQELQRGMLPGALPRLPSVTAAARYLPANQTVQVGGDWYDVIPLSSDRVAFVVGDVMGHGLSEAATMGRLRTAVHTLANLDLPPDDILAHLNDIVSDLGDDFYATCLYALYDPTTRACTFASAGHPPPAIVLPDGSVSFPDLALAPPLGAAAPPFETVDIHMPDGSLLVLYTDGLVESSVRSFDDGTAHLSRILSTSAPPAGGTEHGPADKTRIEALCDTIMAGLLPARHKTSDDAALLVAALEGLDSSAVVSWSLPEHPTAAGQARGHVRSQLATWHLDDLTATTELLVSELIGNVIRHAQGPIQLRLVHSRSLICEVSDGSQSIPRIRCASDTDEGGRGLQLVAALAHRWGARYAPNGKCIWAEQLITV
ncbi:SpoIIE family protein phosphatase [Streptomyces sp. NPDC005474]|uniref:SpoIIE family protein phosphatase n=1 Tax=Streptomyces sp. NPDC005474 TaxID=3154878 RepID=UPI003455EB72